MQPSELLNLFKKYLSDAGPRGSLNAELPTLSEYARSKLQEADERARRLNELTSRATKETLAAHKLGQGVANQELADLMTEAYNPSGIIGEVKPLLMGMYRGYAGEAPGELVYHAGAAFKGKPNPGLFTNPDIEAVREFGRNTGAEKLHRFEARPRRVGTESDIEDIAKRLGIYQEGTPAAQYLEQGENRVFDEAPQVVEELRNLALDSVRLNDLGTAQPSLVALDPGVLSPASNVFLSPQRRVAEYYAQKRAAQTGLTPHVEMVLTDPFAGRKYGHSTPGSGAVEPLTTQAREVLPEDVVSRTQLYSRGGLARLKEFTCQR